MRVRLLAAAACAALLSWPAAADIKTFAQAGGWEAFGGVTSQGRAMCGVATEDDDSWFALKYFKGDKVLTVQLSDATWKAKEGDKITVGMKFDDHRPWRATATVFMTKKNKAALEFEVSSDVIDDWMDQFKESYKLFVVFPDSNVDSWITSLKGTKVIGEAMEECVGWMSK